MKKNWVVWCGCCKEIFAPPEASGGRQKQECPVCGSLEIEVLEYRRLDSTSVSGPAPFEYVCHTCALYFEVSSPADPDELANITCPGCGRRDMQRLHICNLETMGSTCFG